MKVLVKSRYGDYVVEAVEEDPETYAEENIAQVKTPGGKVAFYGWTLVAPEPALQYVQEIAPLQPQEPEMEDYRQVAPEEASDLVKQGYVYTGERWRGLVGVAKYRQQQEKEEGEPGEV